jgi:hypothetical protein
MGSKITLHLFIPQPSALNGTQTQRPAGAAARWYRQF